MREEIELVQIQRFPGNCRVRLKTRLPFFTGFVNRLIDIFECTTGSIFNYPGPGFISFAEGDRVSVARPSISSERLVRNFSDVWTAHYNGHACKTNRVGDSIGFLGHSSHGADAD